MLLVTTGSFWSLSELLDIKHRVQDRSLNICHITEKKGQSLERARTPCSVCSRLAQHQSWAVNHGASKFRQRVNTQWASYLCPSDFWPCSERKSVYLELEKHRFSTVRGWKYFSGLMKDSFCHLRTHNILFLLLFMTLALLTFEHISFYFIITRNCMVTLWAFNIVSSILPVFLVVSLEVDLGCQKWGAHPRFCCQCFHLLISWNSTLTLMATHWSSCSRM